MAELRKRVSRLRVPSIVLDRFFPYLIAIPSNRKLCKHGEIMNFFSDFTYETDGPVESQLLLSYMRYERLIVNIKDAGYVG